jgi:bile acid-coenzyme A ligase
VAAASTRRIAEEAGASQASLHYSFRSKVEAALDEHPAVQSSCVIGLPDPKNGETVQTSVPVEDDELLAHLAERLVRYKLPRSIERVDRPLRDDAGKVWRAALRAERVGVTP